MFKLPNTDQIESRLRRVSELRDLFHTMHESARKAHARGEFPFPPAYDIRRDVDYWKAQRQKLINGDIAANTPKV